MGDAPITAADKLKEIDRELGQRRWVYPRLVSSGKLTQQKADRQIAVLEAVRDDYRAAAKQGAEEGYLL